ncbi:hypothetical protein GCM10011324_33870 [Allosediminivita pacifica]|nr:hypothetical protein GCM10011324_33870 [Allosediminivita pacifica]
MDNFTLWVCRRSKSPEEQGFSRLAARDVNPQENREACEYLRQQKKRKKIRLKIVDQSQKSPEFVPAYGASTRYSDPVAQEPDKDCPARRRGTAPQGSVAGPLMLGRSLRLRERAGLQTGRGSAGRNTG